MVFGIYYDYCKWALTLEKIVRDLLFSELIIFIDKIILEKSRISS